MINRQLFCCPPLVVGFQRGPSLVGQRMTVMTSLPLIGIVSSLFQGATITSSPFSTWSATLATPVFTHTKPRTRPSGTASPSSPLPSKPSDPAYFSGNTHYYNRILRLNAFLREHGLPTHYGGGREGAAPTSNVQWMSAQEMKHTLGIKFTSNEDMYPALLDKLHTLVLGIPDAQKSPSLMAFLQEFARPGTTLQREEVVRPGLDTWGRSYTVASRKSAKCQVWMIPGDGQIFVDGIHMSDRFPHPYHIDTIMRAFDCTQKWGEYNVWALTEAGGPSGKAGALAVAIARGLAVHQVELEPTLKAEGLLDIDRRQKERKKTGQPKARKKKSWVKR